MRRTREAEIARRTHATEGHDVFEKLPTAQRTRQVYSYRCVECQAIVHVTEKAMEAAAVGAGVGKLLEDEDTR